MYISDVQALRRADQVAFGAADGVGVIEASLVASTSDHQRIYTAKEQLLFPAGTGPDRHRRLMVAADIAGFDAARRWHDRQLPGATATTIIVLAQIHDPWHSVAAFLRVGDILRLRWHADTSIDQLARHGLHRDDLHLEVLRGQRLSTFLIQVAVRPMGDRTVTPAPR